MKIDWAEFACIAFRNLPDGQFTAELIEELQREGNRALKASQLPESTDAHTQSQDSNLKSLHDGREKLFSTDYLKEDPA